MIDQKKRRRLLYRTFTAVFMIIIFSFSAKTGKDSAGMSFKYAKSAAKLFGWLGVISVDSPEILVLYADSIHTLIRKAAHFIEYMILGCFTYQAVACDITKLWKAVGWSQLICSSYAATDEFHQRFVPGREGRVLDVVIDSAGALAGIFMAAFLHRMKLRANAEK